MKHITIAGLIIAICGGAEAFSTPSKISHQQRIRVVQFPTQNAGVTKIRRAEKSPSRTSLRAFSGNHGSLILAATEVAEWRQYVPLIVICGVLLDIVLGSPLANTALGPMKRASGVDGDSPDESKNSGYVKNPGERVNCDEVADAVLQRARYSMELRKFLDENKTNEQTYEEIRKEIDQQAAKLEDNLDKLDLR